jgi:short-subunit dehydrogenase
VNIVALTHLTRLFLPGMLARKRGGVLNVASTASFQGGPGMAVYYASKAYVLSFSEAISEETAGTGVVVTALCPGATATEFPQASGMKNSKLFERASMSAAVVARIGHRAFRKGRFVVCRWSAKQAYVIFNQVGPTRRGEESRRLSQQLQARIKLLQSHPGFITNR